MILESGESKWLVLGVVFENNGTDKWPGVERGTVGYRTLDSRIFDAGRLSGKSTTGIVNIDHFQFYARAKNYIKQMWAPSFT